MKDFRNLKVWEKSHKLALSIYKVTQKYPKEEKYGLINQMRRAVVSIPGNISEGCGKYTDSDFARYIQIALGSSSEMEYYIELSHDLRYLNKHEFNLLLARVQEIKKMLITLNKTLRSQR